MRIGVISDTHGLLRPEAITALAGVDHILHAGDVGDALILDQLARIAPVTAIRGNVDRTGPCSLLAVVEMIELGHVSLYMLHDLKELDLDPGAAGVDVVISGHSHQASIERKKSVLYLNPGSAGPRRFSLPVSLASLSWNAGQPEGRIIQLL